MLLFSMEFSGITLIGGPADRAGWRAMFPNENGEPSAGCTKRWCGELRKRAGGLQKRAALQTAQFLQPAGPP